MARELTEWPVSATLWASVPAERLPEAVRVLLTLPEVRLCSSVTGPQNLLFTVWLHTVADVQRLETQLGERLPQLVLRDRSVVLRQTKLMGRLLDPRGRVTGVVPVDPGRTPAPRRRDPPRRRGTAGPRATGSFSARGRAGAAAAAAVRG
ncbi:Lrp/AsnC ligand binding domain-containing protein [Streptomyces albulus]|nr:Lrp/AsnC ligand binding domain-containing protein [Streptomyces noursei]